ncbi:alpha-hydroxy-acid oxidizing protein [Roseisolibacter sp. H3M3-2]|uniref:alpha-hydroxy-acid oxidizing protein n=1 Tax=Roseisolibacter sp. H3M3-2 TaxID=3031323 RepID=UPI0023DB7C5E|nr:alpha-hydroxy-acid oxidizing protein [Roseisolibacter sp. H3M3-2]MDF1504676.1 alpha-hydroxy-acid oxidizing protein [Roseisolibacter sp. H3M3-2]
MPDAPPPLQAPAAGAVPYGLAMQLRAFDPSQAAEPLPPVSPEEWEAAARAALADGPFHYVAGGAGGDATVRANRDAFARRRLVPRMLRDVSRRDLSVELLGARLPAPVLLAPIGVLGILHADAEAAPARAAAAEGVPFVCSTVSSIPMERVAEAMEAVRPGAPRWFQLYPARRRDVMASLLARAERAGYGAVVVTLDTTMLGWREADLRHRYLPFVRGEGLANYFGDPAFRASLAAPPEQDPRAAVQAFLGTYVHPGFSWDDLAFMRASTQLPLLLKGILHPDDARRALDAGADGVVVSNHGGRQVDGAVAALDALPRVADAVAGRAPVLMDSGVRRGADVLKALALGARAVLYGRPYAHALAAGGEAGVRHALRCLLADLDLTMGLCGCASTGEVDAGMLA